MSSACFACWTPSQTEGQIDVDGASYFLSDLELTMGAANNMAQWRKHQFIATSHITADAANYFGLPPTARWSWVHGLRSSLGHHSGAAPTAAAKGGGGSNPARTRKGRFHHVCCDLPLDSGSSPATAV